MNAIINRESILGYLHGVIAAWEGESGPLCAIDAPMAGVIKALGPNVIEVDADPMAQIVTARVFGRVVSIACSVE